eukprot:120377_1
MKYCTSISISTVLRICLRQLPICVLVDKLCIIISPGAHNPSFLDMKIKRKAPGILANQVKRRTTTSIPPILRNNLHQTSRMRPQIRLINPLSDLIGNTSRLHHLTVPVVATTRLIIVSVEHGTIG